jgi:hypothetical protein
MPNFYNKYIFLNYLNNKYIYYLFELGTLIIIKLHQALNYNSWNLNCQFKNANWFNP